MLDGIELWVQAPVHRLTVQSAGGDSESTGLGDIRLAARLGPELSVESGHSFTGVPVYVVGWAGYRLRGENREAAREPGDEVFVHAAVGGMLRSIAWELGSDWLWGAAPEAQGLELPGEKRRLFQLVPTLGVTIAGGRLELTAQVPVTGRNLPAGAGISLGYRIAFGVDEPEVPFPMEFLMKVPLSRWTARPIRLEPRAYKPLALRRIQ